MQSLCLYPQCVSTLGRSHRGELLFLTFSHLEFQEPVCVCTFTDSQWEAAVLDVESPWILGRAISRDRTPFIKRTVAHMRPEAISPMTNGLTIQLYMCGQRHVKGAYQCLSLLISVLNFKTGLFTGLQTRHFWLDRLTRNAEETPITTNLPHLSSCSGAPCHTYPVGFYVVWKI